MTASKLRFSLTMLTKRQARDSFYLNRNTDPSRATAAGQTVLLAMRKMIEPPAPDV